MGFPTPPLMGPLGCEEEPAEPLRAAVPLFLVFVLGDLGDLLVDFYDVGRFFAIIFGMFDDCWQHLSDLGAPRGSPVASPQEALHEVVLPVPHTTRVEIILAT